MKKILLLIISNIFIIGFSANFAYSQTVKTSGKLTDKYSGLPLAGAYVKVHESPIGIYTDNQGNFSLELPKGTYHLSAYQCDYETLQVTIDVNQSKNITYNLKPIAYQKGSKMSGTNNEATAKMSAISKFMGLLEYVFLHKLWE